MGRESEEGAAPVWHRAPTKFRALRVKENEGMRKRERDQGEGVATNVGQNKETKAVRPKSPV